MPVKQIMLRGISRNPSDRKTSDGGLAESLNLQLDEQELAPALKPVDISGSTIGDNFIGDVLFYHKIKNDNNFKLIVKNGLQIGSISNGQFYPFLVLHEGEIVRDIVAVGSTLIITTGDSLYYVLYKDSTYSFLGNKIPEPLIDIQTVSNNNGGRSQFTLTYDDSTTGFSMNPIVLYNSEAWQYAIDEDKSTEARESWVQQLNSFTTKVWDGVQSLISNVRNNRSFFAPFLFRYALKLKLDGTYVYQSAPILVGTGYSRYVEFEGTKLINVSDSSVINSRITATMQNLFRASAYLKNDWDITGWEDIVDSIDLFITIPFENPINRSKFTSLVYKGIDPSYPATQRCELYGFTFENQGVDEQEFVKKIILDSSQFHRIASIPCKNVSKLISGYPLSTDRNVLNIDYLAEQPLLEDDQTFGRIMVPSSLMTYNERVIYRDIRMLLSRGSKYYTSTVVSLPDKYSLSELNFSIRYYIRDNVGETHILLGKNNEGGYIFSPTYSIEIADDQGSFTAYPIHSGWLTHPDVRCYKAEIWCRGYIYELPMESHPNLTCSFGYFGIDNSIEHIFEDTSDLEQCTFEDFIQIDENDKYNELTKIAVSNVQNPFYYPITGQYSFFDNIIGVATITKALSQGQFGEFPLYVFTQGGIWAMATRSDGLFDKSVPVSRDVALGKTICPLDQSIVFSTDKGVLILSSSDLKNVSQQMVGHHYKLEDDVYQLLLTKEDWNKYAILIHDNDTFMKFIESSNFVQDYKGNRLLCFNHDKGYAYIFILDSETWHKIALPDGMTFDRSLNSYPESIVAFKQQTEYNSILLDEDPYRSSQVTSADFEVLLSGINDDYDLGWSGEYIHFAAIGGVEEIRGDQIPEDAYDTIIDFLFDNQIYYTETPIVYTKLLDYSTVLDDADVLDDETNTTKGIIATRPLDFGELDVRKVLKDLRIRGQYNRGNVKYILLASMDGLTWGRLTSLRGGSYKWFRIIILADLAPTERISWIDVDYETRFANKLR